MIYDVIVICYFQMWLSLIKLLRYEKVCYLPCCVEINLNRVLNKMALLLFATALPASSKYPSTAGKDVDEEKIDHWKRSRDMHKEKFLG